jgi:hypothetical protein
MTDNPRSQHNHGRQNNHQERNEARRQNASHPENNSGEEDVQRGRQGTREESISSRFSSIDYDRNAE